jgi:hypothetical protein
MLQGPEKEGAVNVPVAGPHLENHLAVRIVTEPGMGVEEDDLGAGALLGREARTETVSVDGVNLQDAAVPVLVAVMMKGLPVALRKIAFRRSEKEHALLRRGAR